MSTHLPTSTGSRDSQRLRRAIDKLDSRLKESPRNGELALALSEALLRMATESENPEKCRQMLLRAGQLDPYDPVVRVRMAEVFEQVGDHLEAERCLSAALALAPGRAELTRKLAQFYLRQLRSNPRVKLAELTLSALEAAVKANPGEPTLYLDRLEAACLAPVREPAKSPLAALLPRCLLALPPSSESLPRVIYLGTCAVFAIYHPRHAPLKRPPQSQQAADRVTRAKLFSALRGGLKPWLARFPDDEQLAMIPALVDIFSAADEELATRIEVAAGRIPETRLLQLAVHQRLEEIRDPSARTDILSAVNGATRTRRGLDGVLLSALNGTARAAVQVGDHNTAERCWHAGLDLDPYCLAFHHNLALLALCRRQIAALRLHLQNTVELLLTYWQLAPDGDVYLRRIGACFESLASRSRTMIEVLVGRTQGEPPDGVLVAMWLREAQAALVLHAARVAGIRPEQSEPCRALIQYIRVVAAHATLSVEPPAVLQPLLDPALARPAPLHYAALDVGMGATASEVQKHYTQRVEVLQRTIKEAVLKREVDTAERVQGRLRRIEEAFAVIGDPESRRQYDAACLPMVEHEYHTARREFVREMHTLASQLEDLQPALLPVVCRAYSQLPHENLDVYFDALEPAARVKIRDSMMGLRVRPLIKVAQVEMGEERWGVARDVLLAALHHGADHLSYAHYLMAICELKLENAAIAAEGRPSGPAVHLDDRFGASTLAVIVERCVLVVQANNDDEDPQVSIVDRARVSLGSRNAAVAIPGDGVAPLHAHLEQRGHTWVVHPQPRCAVTVSALALQGPHTLAAGDRIGLGAAGVSFFPCAGRGAAAPVAGGFSWARYHVGKAVECTRDDEDFVARLTELLDAIDTADRHAVMQPVIRLMHEEKWAEALTRLDRLLQGQPRHALGLLHRAICMQQLERHDDALAAAKAAQTFAGDDDDVRTRAADMVANLEHGRTLRAAMAAIKRERFAEAVSLFRELPTEVLAEPRLLFICCMARARLWVEQGRSDFKALSEIKADLRRVMRTAEDEETRSTARSLLTQLGGDR